MKLVIHEIWKKKKQMHGTQVTTKTYVTHSNDKGHASQMGFKTNSE